MTMGLHADLDEAARIATSEMLDFLVANKGLSREDAYMLASAAMDLIVTQTVDGTKGIHAMIPKASSEGSAGASAPACEHGGPSPRLKPPRYESSGGCVSAAIADTRRPGLTGLVRYSAISDSACRASLPARPGPPSATTLRRAPRSTVKAHASRASR